MKKPLIVAAIVGMYAALFFIFIAACTPPQEPQFNLEEIRRSACLSRDGFVYLQSEELCVVGIDLRHTKGKTIHQSVREFAPPVGSVNGR